MDCMSLIAQDNTREDDLTKAYNCFWKGEYQEARSFIKKYATKDGDRKTATELSEKCKSCEEYLNKANTAYIEGDLGAAEYYFIKLRGLNPLHPNIQQLLDKCQAKSSDSATGVESVTSPPTLEHEPTLKTSFFKNLIDNLSNLYCMRENSYCRSKKNEYIAWGVGGGYPWNIVTSFEYRGGGIVGFGLYGDIGVDLTIISYEEFNGHYHYIGNNQTEVIKGQRAFSHISKYTFRYAGGLKFYPYKGLFLDFGYGTIASTSAKFEQWVQNPSDNVSFSKEEQIREQVSVGHGWLFHVGYTSVSNLSAGTGGVFFCINGGLSYDVVNKEMTPSINIKWGFAF